MTRETFPVALELTFGDEVADRILVSIGMQVDHSCGQRREQADRTADLEAASTTTGELVPTKAFRLALIGASALSAVVYLTALPAALWHGVRRGRGSTLIRIRRRDPSIASTST